MVELGVHFQQDETLREACSSHFKHRKRGTEHGQMATKITPIGQTAKRVRTHSNGSNEPFLFFQIE